MNVFIDKNGTGRRRIRKRRLECNQAQAMANEIPSNPLLEAALDYARHGLSVFPLAENGKAPDGNLTPHGWVEATWDEARIRSWWRASPGSNIGIATGKSNLVVLDIDVKNGKDGRAAIADKDMGGAVHVLTPSGGHHYYYKVPHGESFQSGANRYGFAGLDVRARGAYIVAPPSVIDGKRYTLDGGALDYTKLAPAPDWLIGWERKRQTGRPKNAVDCGEVTPAEYGEDVLKRAEAYIEKVPESIQGQNGSAALMRASTVLMVGFRLDEEDALELLRTVYNPRCVPPWSEKELLHKVRDAAKNGLGLAPGYLLARRRDGNGGDIRNWAVETVQGEDGETKDVLRARPILEIADEVRDRFGGFPKRLGEELFDFDEAGRCIVPLQKPAALSAWLQGKGKCLVSFRRGVGFVGMDALFEFLHQTADQFTVATRSPFWPKRADVFDLCGDLPKSAPQAEAFWKLIGFLCPATDNDRLLMAAAFIAPLYYSQTASRPAWCIDTVDAQGAGKSTVVKLIARLYGCGPIDVDFSTLKRDESAFKKRVVSSDGRQSRIALIDNITGDSVASASLAKFVTASSISERAAYGRGESSRENDLTWFLTMNGASFDADMASRCYTFKIRKPVNPDPFWEEVVFRHIDGSRLQILADMAAMLDRVNARPRAEVWVRRDSRFARFDSLVLAAVCRDRDEFDALDSYLSATATETNVDQVAADTFAEAFAASIRENYSGPGGERWNGEAVVVTPANIDAFLKLVPELAKYKARDVRQWVKADMIPDFDREFDRLQNSHLPNQFRARGSFCYRPRDGENATPLTPLFTVKIVSLVTNGSSNYRWDVVGETRISA